MAIPLEVDGLGQRTLNPRTVIALAIIYTLALVIPFYISPTTRPSPTLTRDHPSVIRTRIRLVTATCLLCAPITIGILRTRAGLSWAETWHLLGVWPTDARAIFQPVLLTAILFAGPLYERAVADGGLAQWATGAPLRDTLSSWIGIRNYVAGPISEEVLFRSLLTPLYLCAAVPIQSLISPSHSTHPVSLATDERESIVRTIFLSPLPFALAHLHHLHASRLINPDVPLIALILASLLQFAYTALFGWFAAFVFVRTASLPAVVLAHSLANWMGLPRVWGAVGVPEIVGLQSRHSETLVRVHTLLYYVLLFGGAYGFHKLLWTLTQSRHGLVAGF